MHRSEFLLDLPLYFVSDQHLILQFRHPNLKLSCHAGPYKLDELIAGFADLHQQYGDVVRLKLGQETVLIFNPDDIRLLFQHEGKYPKRPTFEALKKYRKEKHGCVGIVPE